MSNLVFVAQFIASKVGKDGLSPTWNVERITRSDGTRSALVTGGATSIVIGRNGQYGYLLTGADLTLYAYTATAITSDATVDQKEMAAMADLVLADAIQLSGDSGAADNAESFFDGTGYAGTNNVIPTVTTLTNMPAAAPNVGAIGTEIWAGTYTRQINSVTGNIGGDVAGKVLGGGSGTITGTGAQTTIAGTLTTLDALWAKVQKWLRLGFRKDAAVAADHAAELAEINANGGSGAGAFVNTTDSQEAIRDNMGAIQSGDTYVRLTGTVEPAIADLPTNAELATVLAGADDAVLAAIGGLNDLDATGAQAAAAAALAAYGVALETTSQDILTDTGTTLDALVKDIPTTAEMVALLAGADDAVLAAIGGLNDLDATGAQAAAAAALAAYGVALETTSQDILTTLAGGGGIPFEYTELNDIDNVTPLVGVRVRVTTDEAGLNFVSENYTDVFGKIVFHLDTGTYWFFRYRVNTVFAVNPISFIVS